MAEGTKISWAHSTLNYWIGCTRVSAACGDETGGGCYAEREWADRKHRVEWGPHGDRSPTKTWKSPYLWQRQAPRFLAQYGERRRVFVNSLSDFCDNHRSIEQGWRDDAHRAWRECPDLNFLILTKRPQNYEKPGYLPADWSAERYPNVWLGTTVENQAEAERRVPHLLAVPARIRFLSCEPLLGPVDLGLHRGWCKACRQFTDGSIDGHCMDPASPCFEGEVWRRTMLDWVITGGESGSKARPSHPDWFRSLRDQCAAAGVAFHMKQWGEWAPHRPQAGGDLGGDVRKGRVTVVHPTGQTEEEVFIATGGRNTIPGTRYMARVGAKRSGHLLDGVEHRAVPS